MPDGTLIFDTRIDNKGFDKGLDDLERKASGSAGDVMKGILGSSAIQKGAEKLMEFGQQAIETASDLQEVQNVVDVTFGEGAAQIEKFSEEAGTAFGLTELQAKQMTGTIGAMVKSMGLTEDEALEMSQSLTALTGDMASFYNLDHETAFQKIRSGISGETEPLKALGINLSVANLEAYRLEKGLKKAYDEMSEAEKVQLRYGYIMEQTADAQGDFNRTQDSYANQVRILQNNLDTLAANIGSRLLPILTSATSALNQFFAGLGDNNEPQIVQDINNTIAALSSLETAVTQANNSFANDVIDIQVDYQQAQDAIEELENLQNALIGGKNLKLGDSGEEVKKLQQRLSELGYEVEKIDGIFGEDTLAALKQYQADMKLTVDGIAGVNTLGELNEETLAALKDVTSTLLELYPELGKYVGKDGVLAIEAKQVSDLVQGYKDLAAEKAVNAYVGDLKEKYYGAALNMELLKEQQKQADAELKAARATREKLVEAGKLLNESFGATQSGWDSLKNKATISEDPEDIERAAAALQKYMDVFGELPKDIRDIAAEGGLDMTKLINLGDPSKLLDPETLAQSEESLKALYGVVRVLAENPVGSDVTGQKTDLVGEDIQTIGDKIASLKTSSEEAGKALEELDEEFGKLEETYFEAEENADKYLKTITATAKEAGERMGKDTADGLAAQDKAVGDATGTLIDEAQAVANRRPIKLKVVTQSTGSGNFYAASHATGLDYVPYNGYLASLHQGESVLTAADAQAWRNGRGGAAIDYQALAAAVAAGQQEAPERPVVLVANGRVIAEALAGDNRTAINSYNRRIAEGMGKR